MTEPGYQCQECRRTFTDHQCCGSQQEGDIRCPTCRSADVINIDLPEDWGYVLRSSSCFG